METVDDENDHAFNTILGVGVGVGVAVVHCKLNLLLTLRIFWISHHDLFIFTLLTDTFLLEVLPIFDIHVISCIYM